MTSRNSGSHRRPGRGVLLGRVTEQDTTTPCANWWIVPSVEPDAIAQNEEVAQFAAADGHYRRWLRAGHYWVTAFDPDNQRRTETKHVVIEAGKTTVADLHAQ